MRYLKLGETMCIKSTLLLISSLLLIGYNGVVAASIRCNNAPHNCTDVKIQEGCENGYMISFAKYYNCEWHNDTHHCTRGRACHLH